MKTLFSTASILVFLALPFRVLAIDVPTFPTCSNPEGRVVVSYDSGTHGIVGNPGVFTGTDKVYSIDDTRTLQCFCGVDGNGIQTNWWRAGSLSEEQIEQLKKLGWQFVPAGTDWGLDKDFYMALNTSFSCKTDNGTGGGGSSSSSNGQILSTSASTSSDPSVLGLATTGDTTDILALTSLSSISLVLGIVAKKNRK